MRPFAALLAAAIAIPLLSVPASAQAEIPPQEPGVTLRVFDVQVELNDYCRLKPAQTPNIDKLMPTIDWSTTAHFGFADRFVTEVSGYLHITNAGTYGFRLISDDGARFLLDGTQVIDHPGRHGATAKDGSAQLTSGPHALYIEHFDAIYDQRLRLEWRPPGASAFSLVPNSALSTDADVVRVTAPGRKECEAAGDSAGDGLPLTGVHPNYTLTNLRPNGFEPDVTGMDWLPDGRLAISTWGGDRLTVLGEVYLLGNVTGDTNPSRVTVKRIASGLREPMGLKYVDGTIYVSEKHQLTALVDTTGDEVADTYRRVATWPFGGNYHEFAFGLVYKDGYFYVTTGIAMVPGGATADPQPVPNRGSVLKINRSTGQVEYLAGGLRTPNGPGIGPENDLFVTDNQGMWVPTSKLVRVRQGAFYNHFTNPDGPYDNQPVTQPILWLPHNEISNSPSNPIMVPGGVFAGQMMFGDVTYGGIQRAYLEMVGGEYQGAVFRMTQGLEAGVNRISLGPDGAIYAGGIGWAGNWGQAGKLKFGLQKLTQTNTNALDILRMRAISGGFEIEYTQPLSTQTATNLVTKYRAQQWRYVPTSTYGGPKVDQENLSVTSATLSADRRKVTLKIANLKAGRVVYVRSPRPFSSTTGAQLWSTEAWYTLNRLSTSAATPEENAERITLFNGTNLTACEKTSGAPATWPIANGSMESLGGDIRTKEQFGDFRMHVEWYEPDYPPSVTGQARGNSGVYIHESYELQVLESYRRPPELNGAGAIYLKKAPDVNAARPTRTWQTYDIEFHAARFDSSGRKVENARITVWWNGTLVHDNVAIDGPTGLGKPEAPTGKIKLQDHGDPGANPRFRNIWLERL